MKKVTVLNILIPVISFLIGIYYYSRLPELLPSHWNAQGEVDAYSPKAFNLFFIPGIMILLLVVLYYIPKIDPLKKNWSEFIEFYYLFIFVFELYLFGLYVIILSWSNGVQISMNMYISLSMGFLFIFIGLFLTKTKQNWFAGIRTPWTLSDEVVWKKTHTLGGKVFVIAGIITLFGAVFPNATIWLILFSVLGATLIPTVYSYMIYQKRHHDKNEKR